MRERMVAEMEVVRLRMIRHSEMPDMVTSVASHHCSPEYEDGPPSFIANELPYPDATTVKAMLCREKELRSYNQTQRAYALSLGKIFIWLDFYLGNLMKILIVFLALKQNVHGKIV